MIMMLKVGKRLRLKRSSGRYGGRDLLIALLQSTELYQEEKTLVDT